MFDLKKLIPKGEKFDGSLENSCSLYVSRMKVKTECFASKGEITFLIPNKNKKFIKITSFELSSRD